MDNEIITYLELCQREKASLQRGMNFKLFENYSVILMSLRKNSPYQDEVIDNGKSIIYEGHDKPRNECKNPKSEDQQSRSRTGRLTENGKFEKAVLEFKNGKDVPHKVKVYEKIKSGIWTYNGTFNLVDCYTTKQDNRIVFKFKLEITDDIDIQVQTRIRPRQNRVIPSWIKQQVYKRDQGKCVICGKNSELHYDHDFPYSKGGTSITSNNIRLLCARHNLEKSAKIE